mmetsp:Transcript_9461/g.22412  ORF Transcript_9461/g.22412 Transcript_9461/m.22412 type:complete len:133 (-) Transcript_9461:90-488(-)
MSFNSMGGKASQARPPEKGSFPLDREHRCEKMKSEFLTCLKQNDNGHAACRAISKAYLECRQQHELMDDTPLAQLGFTDAASEAAKKAATNDLNGEKNKGDWVAGMHIKERPKSSFAISDPSTWFKRGGAQH